jgi:Skp family chaperone for outer membrane proteins
MVALSRGILAIGLSLLGLAFLVSPSLGQLQDGSVRTTKTASPATAAPQFPDPVPPIIGTVDIESVFNNYEKVKGLNKEFSAAMAARKNELMKILSQAQSEAEMLAKLAPGTEDYRKHENKVTELKAMHEAGREQAEREFTQRQAEMMATLYKEVQTMVARIAKLRHMNYVIKISNQPVSGGNPNSVMAAVSSTIVYADPANDITNDVTHNLNQFYKRSLGASTTKGASATTAAGVPGTAVQTGERR